MLILAGFQVESKASAWTVCHFPGGYRLYNCTMMGIVYQPVFRSMLYAALIAILSTSACSRVIYEELPTTMPTDVIVIDPSPTIDWFPATATPTPVPTVAETPKVEFFDPTANLGTTLVDDNFSDSSLWKTSKSTSGNVVYGDGNLSLAVAGAKGSLSSLSPYSLPQDFYMEMHASVSLCQYGEQYGLLFWYANGGDTYRLTLTCDGRLRLELLAGNSGVVLQDWTYASKLMPGAPAEQKIGLWAKDGELQVFVNDTFQFMVKTRADREGGLGVYAKAAGDTAMTIGFSQLKVFQLKPGP
jgi:hypothetical protein